MINIKQVETLLKKEVKKGFVLWKQTEEAHYITNRYFALKIKHLPVSLLSLLIAAMQGKQPHDFNYNQVSLNNGIVSEANMEIEKIFNNSRLNQDFGQITSFLYDTNNKKTGIVRIAKSSQKNILLNNDYVDILENKSTLFKTNNREQFGTLLFEYLEQQIELIILPLNIKDFSEQLEVFKK